LGRSDTLVGRTSAQTHDAEAEEMLLLTEILHFRVAFGIVTWKYYRLCLLGKENYITMLKLLMQWDIKMGREQDFSEFVVREFAPRLMQLGIEPSEVLYTMYGEGPQMLTMGVVENQEKLTQIMQSNGWKKLREKLMTYVTNYSQKVVVDNGSDFQI